MKTSYRSVTCIAVALSGMLCSCQSTTEQQDKAAYTAQSVINPAEQISVPEPKEEEPAAEPVYYNNHPLLSKSAAIKNDEHLTKTEYTVREQVIDSLNKIAPLYDNTKYNKASVTYFTSLAHDLGGRAYYAQHADSLNSAIMNILNTRLDDGTDIVFLIDKTGSMDDDLDRVKQSLGMIMDYLSHFSNVKLAIASYGDKNYQYDLWYNRMDLTSDVDQLRDYMNSYTTVGNPDVPESVNDAIVKTVKEMNWTEGNKRMMLVIGDAPSQQPPLSDYSDQQVVEACAAMNVQFNLYPIIISVTPQGLIDTPFRRDFAKAYPNPANESLTLDFDENATYYYELDAISGKKVMQATVNTSSARLDMTSIPNGTYLLQIYNQLANKYYSSKIIVQH